MSKYFSVVVPVKNEAESVPVLAEEISEALNEWGGDWECVWINDGSDDDTADVLERLCRERGEHQFFSLDRNYGQSAALAMGFTLAGGEVIGTLDGDSQNDPHDFPRLLEHLEKTGATMVNGVRAKRKDTGIRKICSKIANGFRNWLTRETVTDVGCAIRVFRRDALKGMPVFKGMHRFLPTLTRMNGGTIDELPVNHRPRERGKTKYGINNRLWVGLADSFAVRWMQWRLVFPKCEEAPGKDQ